MLLKAKLPEQQLVNTYASLITKEALRIKNHAEQVLQVAHIEKERLHLKKELLDAHELVLEVADTLNASSPEQKANIKLRLEALDSSIKADKLHFTNILFNLFDNAIKYGCHTPEIVISTTNIKKSFVLSVSDNGPGIPPKEQTKIFQKFYRVPTGRLHDVKGYGLGLYYVKSLMKAHKGIVLLKSQSQKGCDFQLRFPLAR